MDSLALGSFIFLNLICFALMGYGMTRTMPLAPVLSVVSMVLFFALGLLMVGDLEVVTESTTASYTYQTINPYSGTVTTLTQPAVTTTQVWMQDEITDTLTWLYLGLGTFTMVLFISRWARPGGS